MATFGPLFAQAFFFLFYIFTYISSFKAGLVEGIFRFQKWFDEDVLDFQLSFDGDILAFFWLGSCFGSSFSKIWAFFNILVTL
jgi:hypothetical protein